MNKINERLLFILMIGVLLVGVLTTGAMADLSIGSSPSNATANSVWTLSGTWTDSQGAVPTLMSSTHAEGTADYGFLNGDWVPFTTNMKSALYPVFATIRDPIPDAYAQGLEWWPAVPAPDGYPGFAAPADAHAVLPAEQFESPAYSTIQPDPVKAGLEADGSAIYDHGVDYVPDSGVFDIDQYVAVSDHKRGIPIPTPLDTAPGDPKTDLTLPEKVIDGTAGHGPIVVVAQEPTELVGVWTDEAHTTPLQAQLVAANVADPSWTQTYNVIEITDPSGIPAGTTRLYISYKFGTPGFDVTLPAAPGPTGGSSDGYLCYSLEMPAGSGNKTRVYQALLPGGTDSNPAIVLARPPVALVGVWSDAMHTKPVQAKLTMASDLNQTDPTWSAAKYNVVELMDKTIISKVQRLYISYYCAGTRYVITGQNPLPLPYTVYPVQITETGDQFLRINPAITKFDPDRQFDPGDATASNANPMNFDPASLATQCGIMGVYRTRELELGANTAQKPNQSQNLFDLSGGYPADVTPYAVTNGTGKIPLFPTPNADELTAGTTYYVKVATNGVRGVWTSKDKSGSNYYFLPGTSMPIGYCARSGVIRLGTPLPEPDIDPGTQTWLAGQQAFVEYSYLSRSQLTVGSYPKVGYVTSVSAVKPDDSFAPAGKFTFSTANVDYSLNGANGRFGLTSALPPGAYAARVTYYPDYLRPVVWADGAPLNLIRGGPTTGMLFRVAVSAGLNMSNQKQQPSMDWYLNDPSKNNKLIYDPESYPMYYDGQLTPDQAGATTSRKITAVGLARNGTELVSSNANVIVTVHDSDGRRGAIDYGGQGDNQDWLTCYSNGHMPDSPDVDPLSVEPVDNSAYADDGSGSSQFVFRVRYHNDDGLAPLPWLHDGDDLWGWTPNPGQHIASGVVLYLDETGTGKYKPHFMQPDLEDHTLGNDIYEYRVIPHHEWYSFGPTGLWPHQENGGGDNNMLYQSLSMGTYHYFFGCSDDSLAFWDGSFPFQHQYSDKMVKDDPLSKTGREEWGQTGGEFSSTGLDPYTGRAVSDYPGVNRDLGRRYSSDGVRQFDSLVYVDRPTRAPGVAAFESPYTYAFDCNNYPKVTCELNMSPLDKFDKPYDDPSYGAGRFFGTLSPFRNCINPVHAGARGTGVTATLAQTSGSYSKDTNIFRIFYRQVNGKAPMSIQLWINDASEKSPKDDAHTYRSYTMQLSPNQPSPDYKAGVWYEKQLQSNTADLPLGPHTYYFTASDGTHIVRWPVRPDDYVYNNQSIMDLWVPTGSQYFDRDSATYVDNDYVPGPYVNHPPVITNVSVTPGTGKQGTSFKYRATYSDADGQQPFSAILHVEVNDQGTVEDFAMTPETAFDPKADNTALFKAGVNYVYSSDTIDGILKSGARRYYVEFTDDWGRQDDPNQSIKGETVATDWAAGPVISGNNPPMLSSGVVESADLTANAATTWTFRVNYRDLDNDAPQVKLYIGQLQPPDRTNPNPPSDVKTILWDAGHTMMQSDPTDKSYTDGCELYYQTKLGGPDSVSARRVNATKVDLLTITVDSSILADIASVNGVYVDGDGTNTNYYTGTTQAFAAGDTKIHLGKSLPNPLTGAIWMDYTPVSAKQYYYAFEAYDGSDYATYKSSSVDSKRSNAAGCFVLQDVQQVSGQKYKIQPIICRMVDLSDSKTLYDPYALTFDPDPNKIGDIVAVTGVYTNEDLTGTNYYAGIVNGKVQLTQNLTGKVWLSVEADTPIVGPLPVAQPSSSKIITDLQVYQNAASDGAPLLLTDQKNGFINDTGDRAVLTMNGVAEYVGKVSGAYVMPDDPASIASVEGVYWLDNPDPTHRYDNYYDPDHAHANAGSYDPPTVLPPVVRMGSVGKDGDDQYYATVPDTDEIDYVLGVYDDPSLSGINYLAGNGYPLDGAVDNKYIWQEGYVVDKSTVWPRRPMEIAQIKGIYLTTNVGPDNYYDPTAAAAAYAPEQSEYVALTKNLDPLALPIRVYIAYYPVVQMAPMKDTTDQGVLLTGYSDTNKPAYLKVWTKGYNVGDKYVRLTRQLPDLTTPATLVSSTEVKPSDSAKLADMAAVTGVYVQDDPTNYYANTLNPFEVGAQTVRLAKALPDTTGKTITINYLPKQREVTVKYSDIRFTHVNTGQAMEVQDWRAVDSKGKLKNIWLTSGTAFFTSDGILKDDTGVVTSTDGAAITGNDDVLGNHRDVDGGVIGVWTYDPASPNYFNPRRVSLFSDNPWFVQLSTELPTGTREIYARDYQKGDYFIDRWKRELRFEDDHTVNATDRVQVTYFFGTKMPYLLQPNTLPTLSEGKVAPLAGSRNAQYVYSVKYTDTDGPNGQAPSFVRVYIDGIPYDMKAVSQGTPVYRSGAVYTFTPTGGLAGGSRRFHFEASDGAAIAWFDKNGGHQTDGRLAAGDVQDIDGPWVNDPPILSNGVASPNPQTGGIATTDSVDFTVNLKDLDNDAPFVSTDPADLAITGSPRLWVDSAVTDDTTKPMIGTIVGLEIDPLVPSKKRVMVVKVDDGQGNLVDPGWTTDQFAGKLMQICRGVQVDSTGKIVTQDNVDNWSDIFPSPARRVYLIQSNTSNKLTIATDTLEGDKLDPENPKPVPELPADPKTGLKRYAQFRINGLLMTAVAGGGSYSQGVDFKVTIPGLPVGTHKFHFTARTSEKKPDWLLALPGYTNAPPYSVMVRFPSVGELTGPTVTTVIPPSNVAPVLSKSGSSTLYRGPKPQYATVLTPTTAQPSNYIPMLSVLGVYHNANFDAHLAEALRKDFYNPALGSNPPGTGQPVYLSTLTATPDTVDLVQLSSKVDDLLTVTPDVASAIGSVTAVFPVSDPALAGTAYTPVSSSLVNGKIKLTKALPAGTEQVYIKYKPATATVQTTLKAGVEIVTLPNPDSIGYVVSVCQTSNPDSNLADVDNWTPGSSTIALLGAAPGEDQDLTVKYVPWPPVYVKYLAVEPTDKNLPANTHGIFLAGEPVTFKIQYKDANGDPPTFHDGVQGYVKIVFNDTGRSSQLVPQSTANDYIGGMPFGVTLTDVPEGTHAYHFEASDGYVVTRYPTDPTGVGTNDEKVRVNYKPTLSAPSVDHTSGATAFRFSVTYADKDNAAPVFVQVVLTNHNDASKTYPVTLSAPDGSTTWNSGVAFTGSTGVDSSGDSVLPSGTYDAVFYANDGTQNANPVGGIQIVVRDTNAAPLITDYKCGKLLPNGTLGTDAGKTTDTFVYQATYVDADNDPPVYVGSRTPALTLIVDGGTAAEQRFMMTMLPLVCNDPTLTPVPAFDGHEYTEPAPADQTLPRRIYIKPTFQVKVTGKKLGPGNHTYTVIASDGSLDSKMGPGVPARKTGPILMVPFFNLEVVGKDGEPITDRSIVGQEVLIKGKMYFPYTVADQVPSALENITIQVTKPDSTTVALNAKLTNIVTNSATDPTNWLGDIVVTYSGYLDPALVTGQSLTLTASGQWSIGASWPGDAAYDPAATDTNWDGQNDQIRINVAGPCRTIAVSDPLNPANSAPVADMVTPPMMIGSTSPGAIFGYDRAVPLRVVKWVPSSGQYFWYDVGGVFPPLQPGDAVWVKPNIGNSTVTGSGYPPAEPLGFSYTISAVPTSTSIVPMKTYASHINGVYLNSAKTGTNYYIHSTAPVPFKAGGTQIVLTTPLPSGTAAVFVDYVGSQSSVDEGWTSLDNPAIQKVLVGGDPRYVHTKYRLIKVSAQAYPVQTGASGSAVLDPETKLPLLKPCSISLTTGWNQFGNIFFNWKKTSQSGTPAVDGGVPAPASVRTADIDQWNVVPVDTNSIGKVLGVYLNQQLTGTNYYQPGLATSQPYKRGDATIHLTTAIPATTTKVYIRYEAYPRVDVGIPISEIHVTHLGVRKTLAEAKAAGWLTDYAWRFDATQHNYVMVSAAASRAERVLKAWAGYWIKCYVDCQLEIDPNTDYNGEATAASASVGVESAGQLEMPPPAPN